MTRFAKHSQARTDQLAQLMLLVARPSLDAAQVKRARALIAEIEDWSQYIVFASRNASLPFLYYHAKNHHLLDELPEIAKLVRVLAMRTAVQAGQMRQALLRFHDACIAPINAQHVYFKGPVLAELYYDEPSLRSCGDVDVLIADECYREVGHLSRKANYKFGYDGPPIVCTDNEQDIDFMLRHVDCIAVFDNNNVTVEMHKFLEKTVPIFPKKQLLRESQSVQISGRSMQTLSLPWHFCYIIYHHSRHFWSSLNWVADIHAMMAHEDFSRPQVSEFAAGIGLSPMIDAALEFADLTDKPDAWSDAIGSTSGGRFLESCLRGLPGDGAHEREMTGKMFLVDFEGEWQFDQSRKFTFWLRSALHRLQPTLWQYRENRLPPSLQWLYYLENLRNLSGNALKRMSLG